MSNDSQGSPSSRPRFYPSQMQIERLKREDEEEHWISGEELYTEGSSDDEEDLKRLIIGDPEVRGNAESLRYNLIGSNTPLVNAGRSKFSHPGLPRSAQTGNRGFQPIRQKEKSGEGDSSSTSVISTLVAATAEDKLPSSSSSSNSASSKEIETEIADVASGSDAEKEISWRPKRDDDYVPINLISENSIVELRELQFEYPEILDTLSSLKASLSEPSSLTNSVDHPRNTIDDYNYGVIENGNIAEFILEEEAIRAEKESPIAGGDRVIEDVSFNDQDVDRWSIVAVNTAKIKKEMSKIVKLDTCIEELDQKVKKESEDTLEEQISNRKELRRLQIIRGAPETGKLAKNSQLFFKLCSMEIEPEDQDIESVYTVLPIYQSQDELDHLEELQISEIEFEEEESRESRREKLEEQLTIIDKRRASFIERNKKLASCAMGTLSITDEEKKRLEELVKEIDNEGVTEFNSDQGSYADNYSTATPSTPYTIDKEADELLKKLNEQLKNINSETYRKSEEENRLRYSTREELIPQKEQLVINSLRSLADSGSKMIHPISEEEIRQLIDEYYAEEEASSSRISLEDFGNDSKFGIKEENRAETPVSINSQTPAIAKDVIDELVKEAKTAMPLFQFKHRTESIEELEDKEEGNDNP